MDMVERSYLNSVLETLPAQYFRKYLDFACGTGRITSLAEKFFPTSHGIDVSESMVEEARNSCETTEFFIKDITREPHDETYDLITSFRFFGNAEDELRVEAARCISSLLIPGGIFIINNHRNPYAIHRMLGYLTGGRKIMDLSHHKIIKIFLSSGFRIHDIRPIGFWVIRHSMMNKNLLFHKNTSIYENFFSSRRLARFSPDSVYMFRKL